MRPELESLLRNEAGRQMAILMSRYPTVVPIALPDRDGCRRCGTMSPEGNKLSLCIFHRGIGDTAVVTVAVLCPLCYNDPRSKELILDEAQRIYEEKGRPS